MNIPKIAGRMYVFDSHKKNNKIFIEAEFGVGFSSFIILSDQETKRYFNSKIEDIDIKGKNMLVEADIKESDTIGRISNYTRKKADNKLSVSVCKRQMFIPNYKSEKLERREEYSVILRKGVLTFTPYYHIEMPVSEEEFRIIKPNTLDHMAEISLKLVE